MPPGPPPGVNFRYEKVPPPKSIADVPRYLKELCGGFFSRLAYIFRLVWKTGPWILFAMLAISLLQGITPVIGITLPFFSYGGTALCLQLVEMGIVLSVSRQIPAARAG